MGVQIHLLTGDFNAVCYGEEKSCVEKAKI